MNKTNRRRLTRYLTRVGLCLLCLSCKKPGIIIPLSPIPQPETEELIHRGSLQIKKVVNPSIEAFFPENPNGTGIVICPGGGYEFLMYEKEGIEVARKLNEYGITAFVLKYRLPTDHYSNRSSIALHDLNNALKHVQSNKTQWNLKAIGVMGFSAGGHLAGSFSAFYPQQATDFQVLIYPVVSFVQSFGHKGSMNALLGTSSDRIARQKFSLECAVSAQTPPTFILHAFDDSVVSIKNSQLLIDSLSKKNVRSKAIFTQKGGHGFGINNPEINWPDLLSQWVRNDFSLN